MLHKSSYENNSKDFCYSLFPLPVSTSELCRRHWNKKKLNKKAHRRGTDSALVLLSEYGIAGL